MYRIITTAGADLGLVEEVRYIKIASNGCYVQAKAGEAMGVAVNGTPYNLIGHDEIADADTVIVAAVELGSFAEKLQADLDYIAMMSDIDLDEEEEVTEEEDNEQEV